MSETQAKFTLRFRNRRTHALLGLIADQRGVSRNSLAEEMLERELETAALLAETDLDETIRQLRDYRRDDRLEQDIAAFAEGEASGEDPLQARMVESASESARLKDAYGVMEAFEA